MIYLDNAATTRIDDDVLEMMLSYLKNNYGNEASNYFFGRESKKAVDIAREKIANSINADFGEIYFTSCGCESNSWAITGFSLKNPKGKHIITSKIEHDSIINSVKYLEKRHGYRVDFISCDERGLIDMEELKRKITEDTTLVSIMLANNEVGTIQPASEIGKICKEKNVTYHIDAVQAYGKMHIDVNELNADMLTITGHKIHAPKGVSSLFIKNGIVTDSIIFGGSQEKGKRGGTENIAYIAGFGKAAEKYTQNIDKNNEKIKNLRDYLIDEITSNIDKVRVNTCKDIAVSNIASFSFEGCNSEQMLVLLDKEKICVSAGSACTAGSLKNSHVLEAMGVGEKYISGVLRFSLSHYTTKEEIDLVVNCLKNIVEKQRSF